MAIFDKSDSFWADGCISADLIDSHAILYGSIAFYGDRITKN
jgi:hypothetical protein